MSLLAKKARGTFEAGVAPVGYIPGVGRGATGFTTRSELGPGAQAITMPGAAAGRGGPPVAPGNSALAVAAARKKADEEGDYSESNFDKFSGYAGSLFGAGDVYDKEDEQADEVWQAVEERMAERRMKRVKEREKAEIAKARAAKPTIQEQFVDVRMGLADVSADEWNAIPDIGDRSVKRRARPERFIPLPDSLILSASKEAEKARSINPTGDAFSGLKTPFPMANMGQTPLLSGAMTDLNQIGAARQTVLNLKLESAEKKNNNMGQTVIDPKGYATELQRQRISSDAEIGDIKRARLLLKSVVQSNSRHAPGWLALARLEEVAGKIVQARKVIAEGCQACPESEDVWLEAARLQTPDNAKVIFARAIRHIPHSVNIWMHAAALEKDPRNKRKVLRRALELVPTSVRLWKNLIELEEPDEARILLGRAVECVPQCTEMWLALAHLETYENAKRVLNNARKAVPTDPAVWIAAAKLEESAGNDNNISIIIKKAVKSLETVVDRDQWLREAEMAEKARAVQTCHSIVRETIGMGIEATDRKHTWMDDAENCVSNGFIETARAIYQYALSVLPEKKSMWLAAIALEKKKGTREKAMELLERSVDHCPTAEILHLMAAKERWLAGDIDKARAILRKAFQRNRDSEQIWLAAVKLESETDQMDLARQLLSRAREGAGTARVWMKSAKLERQCMCYEAEELLLKEGLRRYPQDWRMWLMLAQLYDMKENVQAAVDAFTSGTRNCPKALPLWTCFAQFEEKRGQAGRARSLLEKARLQNPKSPELWLAAVRTEVRSGNPKIASQLLARALQECPSAGILWAEAISTAPRPQQKARSVDALKRCDNAPHVIVAVARLFWDERKLEKARTWFNRAVLIHPDLGDAWANYLRFEVQHGTPEKQQDVIKRCVAADPRHGELWTSISKKDENVRLTTDQLLTKCALQVPLPGSK